MCIYETHFKSTLSTCLFHGGVSENATKNCVEQYPGVVVWV